MIPVVLGNKLSYKSIQFVCIFVDTAFEMTYWLVHTYAGSIWTQNTILCLLMYYIQYIYFLLHEYLCQKHTMKFEGQWLLTTDDVFHSVAVRSLAGWLVGFFHTLPLSNETGLASFLILLTWWLLYCSCSVEFYVSNDMVSACNQQRCYINKFQPFELSQTIFDHRVVVAGSLK